MKGLLIGCGVIVVIIIIILLAVGYFGFRVFKDVSQEVVQLKETFGDLNREYPFAEPEDGLVSADRFRTWLTVRDGMSASVAAYDTIMNDFNLKSFSKLKEHTVQSMHQLSVMLGDRQMSPDEYTWISRNVIGALESGDMRASADLKDVIEAYDGLQNWKNDNAHVQNDNLDEFGVPVTSAQIQRIARLIRQNRDGFLANIKVFHLDVMIYGISQSAPAVDEDAQKEYEAVVRRMPYAAAA
ncbi:hypothetical protein JW948_18440 [bacterium]|nr:hypothetical protein [bacterium]